jgi:hypothetical protein
VPKPSFALHCVQFTIISVHGAQLFPLSFLNVPTVQLSQVLVVLLHASHEGISSWQEMHLFKERKVSGEQAEQVIVVPKSLSAAHCVQFEIKFEQGSQLLPPSLL